MRTFAERLYSALENQLNEVSINGESITDQYKTSIQLCKKAMTKLKNYISSYSFENTEDEIYFINIYKFIMQTPPGSEDIRKEYINYELADIKRFFDHNQTFYQYCRSGSTQMDTLYFTRGGFDVHVDLEEFEEDEQYSTSHDYKLSKVMANERYQDFLNLELQKTQEHLDAPPEMGIELPLTWTSNKTDLVELIYALVALGVFNNGNADIKAVVSFFQTVFHVDLGSYYHKYQDIMKRKKERSAFLDKLKLALLRRIEEKLDEEVTAQQKIKFG
jgi:hypothetical protein